MRKKDFFPLIGTILILLTVGLLFFLGAFSFSRSFAIQTLYPGDEQMWENIFAQESEDFSFKDKPFGVILPHHMAVAYEINGFYKALSKVANPSIVVVIGPNHFERGPSNVLTCENCSFETISGELESNSSLAKSLALEKLGVNFPEAFSEEHSIHSHSSFIKKYFPNAEIFPLILKWDTSKEEAVKLSEWLNENLPPDALVVGSIDFSHYQRANLADYHDSSSARTIRNFDFENIYDLELDSPASLFTVLDLMEDHEYEKASLFKNTNTQNYVEEKQDKTTSHQFWAFFEGEKLLDKGVTLTSFGNIPTNDLLNLNSGWKWDRNYKLEKDLSLSRMLKDIRGDEDRFFVGSDFNIFDLIDGQCEIKKQNELSVSFCKFSETRDYEDDPFSVVTLQKEKADVVYLLYEFSGGEIDNARKKLAKNFAENGVDVFVGRGVKGVSGFDFYKNSLIFYSLGDFVKDSALLTELNSSSQGLILGMNIDEYGYELSFFPIILTNGYPKLSSFSESKKTFMEIIGKSDLPRQAEIDPDKQSIMLSR